MNGIAVEGAGRKCQIKNHIKLGIQSKIIIKQWGYNMYNNNTFNSKKSNKISHRCPFKYVYE